MSQLVQERAQRVPLGALVDREQREQLAELARRKDCSVSRIVRKALAAQLERESRRSHERACSQASRA
jgi:post-segregation antitoxin (ccd killing protein)